MDEKRSCYRCGDTDKCKRWNRVREAIFKVPCAGFNFFSLGKMVANACAAWTAVEEEKE